MEKKNLSIFLFLLFFFCNSIFISIFNKAEFQNLRSKGTHKGEKIDSQAYYIFSEKFPTKNIFPFLILEKGFKLVELIKYLLKVFL